MGLFFIVFNVIKLFIGENRLHLNAKIVSLVNDAFLKLLDRLCVVFIKNGYLLSCSLLAIVHEINLNQI